MSKIIVEALRGENFSGEIPIWFMRQAGRFLPEYMDIRSNYNDIWGMIDDPNVAAEVTLLPIKRFNLDGVIIFSDILIILRALGIDVFFNDKGPNIINNLSLEDTVCFFNKYSDVFFKNTIQPTLEAISIVKKSISNHKTIIGFCGGPITLCCYLMDSIKSKDFERTRTEINNNRYLFKSLIEILTDKITYFLIKQIERGVDVIQLFDSHCSFLNEYDFSDFVVNPAIKIFSTIKSLYPNVPLIGFPRGCGVKYIDYVNNSGCDAVSLDYTIPLKWARSNFLNKTSLQGNLDPATLAHNKDMTISCSDNIIKYLYNNSFVFNLGHGMMPNTPVDNVSFLVDYIKSKKIRINS